ncbi:MAG: hypothetical protein ABI758_01110 [Candidatus Woesebacteria bacterium]
MSNENELAREYVQEMGGGTEVPRLIASACIVWANKKDIDTQNIDLRVLGEWIKKYRDVQRETIEPDRASKIFNNISDF